MSKVTNGVIAIVFALAFGTGAVLATHEANITNTGPGSDNTIVFNNDCDVAVVNSNNVIIDVASSQDANSGHATVDGNTTGGGASSGDASNENSTSFEFVINNELPEDFASKEDCPALVDNGNGDGGQGGNPDNGGGQGGNPDNGGGASNPTLTPTGQGGGDAPAVTSLPDTGVSPALTIAAIAAVSAVSLSVVTRFAAATIRR